MLKHIAKIDKNIKTHFISSNKYFITNNIYPKRNKMKHILKPEKKESPYRSFASKPHTPWARSFCPFRACCFWSFWAFSPYLNHMRNFSVTLLYKNER